MMAVLLSSRTLWYVEVVVVSCVSGVLRVPFTSDSPACHALSWTQSATSDSLISSRISGVV